MDVHRKPVGATSGPRAGLSFALNVPLYVLIGGTRHGLRVKTDAEMRELRLPYRTPPAGRAAAKTERYRLTRERRDGFGVMRHVTAEAMRTVAWASTG